MRKKILCLSLSFSSLLLMLHLYLQFPITDDNLTSSAAQNQNAIHRIPTLKGFLRDHIPITQVPHPPKCITPPLSLYNVTVQPHIKWQNVGKKSGWYIFSAYKDKRLGSTLIRILALSKGNTKQKLFCRTWYNSTESLVTKAKKQELWLAAWNSAKQGKYYHPFLLTCPSLANPIAVSVIQHACHQPSNLISFPVLTRKVSMKNFVVCLKPLKFEQDISMRLLEWLELQFLLGAETVYLYLFTAHPQTLKVIEHYKKLGKIMIERYKLPDDTNCTTGSLWQKRRHEMIIYNDCFYRHIHSHRYVINVDFDEAIVPVQHNTWLDMLNSVNVEHSRLRNSASMSVRNVYFFDQFSNINNSSVSRYMHMLNHIYRSSNFTPPGFAEKSFFRTSLTLMVTNHFALQTLQPQHFALSAIGEQYAHLHHYRKDCPPLMEKDCEENYMKYQTLDLSLWRFKDELVQRVQINALQIGLEVTEK